MYYVNQKNIVHEIIDGEAVMINLENGKYYTANEPGALVWSLIGSGGDEEGLAAKTAAAYGVPPEQVTAGVRAFLDHLAQEGLITKEVSSAKSSVIPKITKGRYVEPRLSVFSDMQELLLLDPVHDVNEHGWPHTRKSAG